MMTKKEQAAFQQAKDMAEQAIALGWPTEPEPKPLNLAGLLTTGPLFIGWWFNSYGDEPKIGEGCSDGVFHSKSSTQKTDSQGCGKFYATKSEAALALRWELCRKYAKTLAWVDSKRKEQP